ncbi:MAG: Ubiquinone biosynthesis protein UbiE, partial [Frankiales bacterium]|nr:Ubiquinone biosynthesis protein UbiE [Frankiales bacterium]
MSEQPGSPTAFEDLVDDYDAARPHYPPALYDALPPLGDALELGAGTGIASVSLRPRSLVVSDLGPRMLARGLAKHGWPGVVCRA